MKSLLSALLLATALVVPASAESIKWARVTDALSLDPHATSQAITAGLLHHIYESLVDTDVDGNLVPVLAQEWYLKPEDPSVWVFKLRPDVKFHDGSAFTAEDVVFSLDRARSEGSVHKAYHVGVQSVTAVDDLTVEVQMASPSPTYPNNLTNEFIMDKTWSEEHDVVDVQNISAGEENYAVRNANGTGHYILQSRDPEVRTVMALNEDHWSGVTPDVTEIEYIVITDPATRTAALLSGEVDIALDIPVQDIERLSNAPGLKVVTGPENRVIYLGYRIGSPLVNSSSTEVSPFTDPRVREAVELAVDRDAIKAIIMRGQSIPTGIVNPPFVSGYDAELAKYPAVDLERAKTLMAEAGYADGFDITLDTSNNRYISDEMISQSVVGMLSQIGIRVNLVSRPMSQHSPHFMNGQSDFFLMGWGVPTYDSAYTFDGLFHTREGAFGQYNPAGYSNPELDALFAKVSSEVDLEARAALVAEAWAMIRADRPVLALHNQVLAYGMRANINMASHPGDMPRMYEVTID